MPEMIHWALKFSVLVLLAGSTTLRAINPLLAQSSSSRIIELSEDSATSRQLAEIRSRLVSAITRGASPEQTTALLASRRRIDGSLKQELQAIRVELAAIERAEFDPAARSRKEELRRTQSLLWIARVELASLASELFAEGSPDGVAMARQAVQLIQEARASFPSAGIVRDELTRLLAEAQLRGGDAEAALHTLYQSDPSQNHTGSQAEQDAGEQERQTELPINTPEELAFIVRIDLAQHQWKAAAEKLQQFFGDSPEAAPRSAAMDLARLQFLISHPQRETNGVEIGQWLDAIEKRDGTTARRNAETMLARSREFRSSDSPTKLKPRSIDPRVLRADARYYLRVGKTLPAAVLFARAAVDDSDENRSIDSAVRSAAILQDESKHSAASQLLRQIAVRHTDNEVAPTLMLQAASLLSDAERLETEPAATPKRVTAHDVLVELLDQWPASAVAATARDTLIGMAQASGRSVEAAELATELPAGHWSESTATRCRELWQQAIVPPRSKPPCHWDDEPCQGAKEKRLNVLLQRMRAAFAAMETNPIAEQTRHACTILLDDISESPQTEQPLVRAEQEINDVFFQQLAKQRLGPHSQSQTQRHPALENERLRDTVVWRLNRDLAKHPTLYRSSASYLLALTEADENIDPQSHLQWLIWSGQVELGLREMRSNLATSNRPGDLLAAVASALADSTDSDDLTLAADLWNELARGIPLSHTSHGRAKVASIVCQWRSGDQSGARSAAELLLLTHPPSDESLRGRLQELLD